MDKQFEIDGEEEYQKGLYLLNSSEQLNYRKALQEFSLAADKGHTEAIFQLGYLYLFGEPQIGRNVKKAIECLQISSQNGLSMAKYYLAECYIYGMGIEKDEEMAIKLFEDAFRQGHSIAADRLSDIYRYGIGVVPNMQKAKEYNYFARVAKVPNAEAKYIGLMLGI